MIIDHLLLPVCVKGDAERVTSPQYQLVDLTNVVIIKIVMVPTPLSLNGVNNTVQYNTWADGGSIERVGLIAALSLAVSRPLPPSLNDSIILSLHNLIILNIVF